ncbi:VanW family protein [Peptacetobacter hiranonis]|uniref:VanW family protein n=1 Tax=Peptacetobacter hiranonis TaxID=89152 RepID=UPI002E78201C|nr:VanW family protein [Peptacetobacter hiranonis]MEE0249109.1 VanW family protein [Peptacetobacter hiranonis]
MAEKKKRVVVKNTTGKKSLKATDERKKLEAKKKALKNSDDIKKNMNNRKKKRVSQKKRKQKKKQRIVASILGVFLLITVFVMAFNFTYIYNGKIARNIYIEGIDVAGKRPNDVKEMLNEKYKVDNIKFEYNGKEYEIAPDTVGLKYNIDQIVDEAYGYTRDGSYYKDLYNYFSLKNKSLKKNIEVVYDEAKMKAEIEKIAKKLDKEPKNATIKIDGSIKTTKSTDGIKLNISKTLSNLTESIDNKKKETIPLVMEKNEAKVKTSDVESVNTKLAEYTTSFEKSNKQRSHNVEKSAKVTSDILLMPGQVFSYNSYTGKTNSKNGYQEAPVIINGKLEQSAGGGVCQTSSTIFNTALLSGMDIVSVTNHSSSLTYVPLGRDATVNDEGLDFKFKNTFDHPVYIKNTVQNKQLTCTIYGNSGDKKNININVENKAKADEKDATEFKTYRIYRDSNGKEIKKEYISGGVYRKIKK